MIDVRAGTSGGDLSTSGRLAGMNRHHAAVAAERQRPLRVLFVIDDLFIGGAERGLVEEVLAFDPRRVLPHVVTLTDAPVANLIGEVRARGIPVTSVHGRGLADPVRLLRLAWLIRRLRPDVVQTSLDYANVLGTLGARLAGRPVVASLRSTITQQFRGGSLKRLAHNLTLRFCAQRVMMVAASAVDEAAREFDLPPDRIVAMPNSVDLARLEPARSIDPSIKRAQYGIPLDVPLACVVARLDEVKGHRYLLDAVPLMRERHPALHFVLVGIGSYGHDRVELQLKEQASRLGILGRFHFVGEREDVLEILQASNLFVLPSLKEGLSRALLEAMGLGKPIVATDAGGHRDVLSDDTGWCVPTQDSKALARAMDHALDDPGEAARRGRQAHALITKEFSIEAHVGRLESLYREVVDE